jgi:hypothetical protein
LPQVSATVLSHKEAPKAQKYLLTIWLLISAFVLLCLFVTKSVFAFWWHLPESVIRGLPQIVRRPISPLQNAKFRLKRIRFLPILQKPLVAYRLFSIPATLRALRGSQTERRPMAR